MEPGHPSEFTLHSVPSQSYNRAPEEFVQPELKHTLHLVPQQYRAWRSDYWMKSSRLQLVSPKPPPIQAELEKDSRALQMTVETVQGLRVLLRGSEPHFPS